MILTVTVSFIFAEDSFAAVEAQLDKAASDHELLFVAAIDVSPSFGRRFAVGTDTDQPLASCKKEKGHNEPIKVQLVIGHQATASFRLQAWAERNFGILLIKNDHVAEDRSILITSNRSDEEKIQC